jgi:hypothetical protein
MSTVPDQFAVVLPNDALAPKLPQGTELIFHAAGGAAEPGRVVLVQAGGQHYARQLRAREDGKIIAAAASDAWPSFESFEVLAVARYVTRDMAEYLAEGN